MTDLATSHLFSGGPLSSSTQSSADLLYAGMLGQSATMLQIFSAIKNIGQSQAPVLITGETGTGKDLCARAVHNHSDRIGHDFTALNCAALPKELIESTLFGHIKGAFTSAEHAQNGLVEQAHRGTLFLDEISELPHDTQAKLLRFLQDGSYRPVGSTKEYISNARIICATNRDLQQEVQTGLFREDLYYRLNVLDIFIPPLRQRETDVLHLAEHFLQLYSQEEKKGFTGFTEAAQRKLQQHIWPGNIRELQNIVRKIVVLHHEKKIDEDILSHYLDKNTVPKTGQITKPLWEIEKHAIEHAIKTCNGNISKAAALLGINPSTIHRKKASWKNLK